MGWRWWWAPRGGARREPRDLPSGHHDGGCAPFGHPRMAATSPSRGTRCDPDPPPGGRHKQAHSPRPHAQPPCSGTVGSIVTTLGTAACQPYGQQRAAAVGCSVPPLRAAALPPLWAAARTGYGKRREAAPPPAFLGGGKGAAGPRLWPATSSPSRGPTGALLWRVGPSRPRPLSAGVGVPSHTFPAGSQAAPRSRRGRDVDVYLLVAGWRKPAHPMSNGAGPVLRTEHHCQQDGVSRRSLTAHRAQWIFRWWCCRRQ